MMIDNYLLHTLEAQFEHQQESEYKRQMLSHYSESGTPFPIFHVGETCPQSLPTCWSMFCIASFVATLFLLCRALSLLYKCQHWRLPIHHFVLATQPSSSVSFIVEDALSLPSFYFLPGSITITATLITKSSKSGLLIIAWKNLAAPCWYCGNKILSTTESKNLNWHLAG